MSMPFRLLITRRHYDALVAQAKAELPNECCGLLAGRVEAGAMGLAIGRVLQRYPLVNSAASPVEYLSEPVSMFAAIRDMRRLGLDILAVYHSHPTSDPIPSRTDLEQNYSEEVVHLIIALKTQEAAVRGWWLTAKDYREAAWQCVDDDSLDPGSKPL